MFLDVYYISVVYCGVYLHCLCFSERIHAQMENKVALVIIANIFLIHLIFTLDVPSFLISIGYPVNSVLAMNLSIGISLLLFPVFGLIVDVYLTRYREYLKLMLFNLAWISIWKHLLLNSVHLFIGTFGLCILDSNYSF